MDDERPEKGIVRELWIREANNHSTSDPDGGETLYLTLCGGEGREIQLLAEQGLIELTEVGGIAEKDQHRVVAIESFMPNVAKLQRAFPGLRILEQPIQSIVHGDRLTRWPAGEHVRYCRARVINLDLNSPLQARDDENAVDFPIVAWVTKLAQLHAEPPRRDWSLCLTLHGEVRWSPREREFAQVFLRENFQREQRFADACRRLFGDSLFREIDSDRLVNFSSLERKEQQQLLMAFVPKLINSVIQPQGWRIGTETNLRYGTAPHAPMVTWIVRFTWDPMARATPDQVYRDSLATILAGAGVIRQDGAIASDLA